MSSKLVKSNYVRLYETLAQTKALKGIALDVFGIVCKTPGLTGGEVFREYVKMYPDTDRSRNEIAKRLSDLSNWGALDTNGTTVCPESLRTASRWVPTGVAPVAKERRRGAQSLKTLITEAGAKVRQNQELATKAGEVAERAAALVRDGHVRDAKPVLSALESRCRFILRFRRLLPKRYVAQTERVLVALNTANRYL